MDFSTATAQMVLQGLGVEFTARPDGLLEVPGDLNLNNKSLTSLPDLSQVVVLGSFNCINNELTSLKGAPRYVGKDFWCTNNRLTTLEHAPKHIGDNLYCYNNLLTTLQGAPAELGGGLYCKDNRLSSLAGAPSRLTVLWCHDNPLTSLEGAPKEFKSISTSDFGDFSSWNEIPEHLRLSDETREKIAAEERARQQEVEKLIKGIDQPLRAPKRASFTKKPAL